MGIIYELDPNAIVGYRGSLVTGVRYKKGLPFDLENFDVDAFIVSNKLANQYFAPNNNWKDSINIPGMGKVNKSVERTFIDTFEGYRVEKTKPFTFRIYDKNQYNSEVLPGGVRLLND